MAKFNLMPNESIILKSENVMHGGLMAAYTDELILTDKNIIHISKGLFGNTKKVNKFSLNQIKLYNGEPQVILEKQQNGNTQLAIYFLNGQEHFGFTSTSRREGAKWVNEIYKLITGNESPNVSSFPLIPGTEYLAETLKGTVNTFKNVFGGNSKANNVVTVEKVTKNCISCSAPLTAGKGKTVQCKYCDTTQVL